MKNRRLEKLYEAALNLGMSEEHARYYATEAFEDEQRGKIAKWRGLSAAGYHFVVDLRDPY